MAVRIIDPTPQPEALKQATCTNCGVRLEFVQADILDGKREHYGGESTPYTYVGCPSCGHRVILSRDGLPVR